MKPFGLLVKYYLLAMLAGTLIGFNQYAFEMKIPFYIIGTLNIFILFGLIYNALKEANGSYTKNDFIIITTGLACPFVLLALLKPSLLGISAIQGIFLAIFLIVGTALLVLGLLTASKYFLSEEPLDDDYDS